MPEPPLGVRSADSPRTAELPRLLGVWSAASILIGSVIGSGVFVKAGKIAADLPAPGWILLAWVTAGLLALIGSLAFAELGARFPAAGGQYTFLYQSFGKLPAFLFGWTNLLIVNGASLAALAVVSATFFFNLLPEADRPADGSHWRQTLPVLAIAALTAANVAGVRWGAAIHNLLTLVKLVAVAALIAGLLSPLAEYSRLAPFWDLRGASASGSFWAGLKGAFLAIFWAYDGWYLLSFSGGEIHNPRRNIPLGFVIGIVVVVLAYVAVNAAYLTLIDLGEMKNLTEGGGAAAEAAMRLYGPLGLTLVSAGIVGSTLGAANGNLLTGPRLAFAMARDGLFFRPLAGVHATFRTPAPAIVFQGAISAGCVYIGTFDQLTDSVVFAAWTFYLLTVLGLIVLRRRAPVVDGAFRTPGYPLLPIAFVLFAAVFIVYSLFESAHSVHRFLLHPDDPTARDGMFPAIVAAIILAGVPVYWRMPGRRGKPSPDP